MESFCTNTFHTYIVRRLGPLFFFWFKILNFNIFGVSERGMKILLLFFWGHHKIGLYLGVISVHFRVVS